MLDGSGQPLIFEKDAGNNLEGFDALGVGK